MNRPISLTVISAIAVFVAIGCFNNPLSAQSFDPAKFNPAKFKQYETQLNAILKTRRDEEKEFVSKVVLLVKDGKIPTKLVSTSFKWVRNKRPKTKYPFVYFERVIRLQAEKIGMKKLIPKFDYSVYKKRISRDVNKSRK